MGSPNIKRVQTHTDPADGVAAKFFSNANAARLNTDAFIYDAIKNEHPGITVTTVPEYGCNLRGYATTSGNAAVQVLEPEGHQWPSSLKWTIFIPPARRLDGNNGIVLEEPFFEKYLYRWKNYEFLVYLVDGRDGMLNYPQVRNQYILSNDKAAVTTLISTVGRWESVLHDEIWVFEQGFWQKNSQLYESIQKSSWDNVILDQKMKDDIIETVQHFYDSRDVYDRLQVPWKRGIIFYGPPGNGKTISIKATMHTLYSRNPPIPTLYVKTLASFMGPEFSISQIFEKARQEAPCYLVFEDLDSLVTDEVRSFFLNAVDGLSENEGILMVGSTNHLERLDPGIAKRPSRFDRKYLFPEPDLDQRIKYCHFWQRKLGNNDDIDFPDKLCTAIAKITDKFSFAYMQEAFISALLVIANAKGKSSKKKTKVDELSEAWYLLDLEEKPKDNPEDDSDLDKYVLWRAIKEQIEMLKKELSDADEE